MKLSDRVKMYGFKSVSQLCGVTNTSRETIRMWYKEKPQLFEALIMRGLRRIEFKNDND